MPVAMRPLVLRLMPVLDFGGVESRIITQSALMNRERFDFRVATFWKKGAAALAVERQGIRVEELGADPSPNNPRALALLADYVFSHGVDVVHASILEANLHAAMLRRLPGAPSVAIEEVGMPVRSMPARVAFGAVYRMADVVVGVSRKACEAVRQQHWLPASKVRLIYNSINPAFLEPTVPAPEGRALRLLAVGRLVEVKNQEVLLRALATLPSNERPEFSLVGEGHLRPHLEKLVKDLGLQSNVRLLGFQSDVKQLLDSADAYLMPSFSEGTSISLAEAMARARPVLTSRADGIDEAMLGYPEGWQLPPTDVEAWANGIRRLMNIGREQRALLGSTARTLVSQRMSPNAWRGELESLYDELSVNAAARRNITAKRISTRVARSLRRAVR